MKTRRHPMDYDRKQGLRTRIEDTIMEWVDYLYACFERGLITRAEFNRLLAEGPDAA